jgi:hypothetical protein
MDSSSETVINGDGPPPRVKRAVRRILDAEARRLLDEEVTGTPRPARIRMESQRILDGIARRLLDEELAAAQKEKGDR